MSGPGRQRPGPAAGASGPAAPARRLARLVRRLRDLIFDPYRPEKHYLRGRASNHPRAGTKRTRPERRPPKRPA